MLHISWINDLWLSTVANTSAVSQSDLEKHCLSCICMVRLRSNLVCSSRLTAAERSESKTDCLSIVPATLSGGTQRLPLQSPLQRSDGGQSPCAYCCARVRDHMTTAPDICRLHCIYWTPDSSHMAAVFIQTGEMIFFEHYSAHAGIIDATDPWISSKQKHRAAASHHIKKAIAICRI